MRLFLSYMLLVYGVTYIVGLNNTEICKDGTYQIHLNDTLSLNTTILTIAPQESSNADFKNNNKKPDCQSIIGVTNSSFILEHSLKNYCYSEAQSCPISCADPNNPGGKINPLVVITVARTNIVDYRMQFTGLPYNISVRENSVPGIKERKQPEVGFPNCKFGSFGNHQFTIRNSSIFEYTSGRISIGKSLDYERKQYYNLTLDAVVKIDSQSGMSVSASTALEVFVIDVDDEDPTFNITSGSYQLNVTENVNSTHFTSTTPAIYAYDKDRGINDRIVYSLLDDHRGTFEINNASGKIAVTCPLDREEMSEYHIIVKATEASNTLRTATAALTVHVEDADDNPPIFEQRHYDATVTENALAGTTVLAVSATDKDKGVNAEFSYEIPDISSPFMVNERGVITVNNSSGLDREKNAKLTFTVRAVPKNIGMPGGNATVTVNVTDVNDNNPNFTRNNYEFTITNTTSGSIVGQVKATDLDQGGNGNVTYSFIHNSKVSSECSVEITSSFPFELQQNGIVSVSNHVTCSQYSVLIQACDNPDNPSTRRCSIARLMIHYRNNSHQSISDVQRMYVLENVNNGTFVGRLKCTGQRYQLNGSETFSIDKNGIVQTANTIDRETVSSYELDTHTFAASNEPICNINVTIDVIDVNDNAPIFELPDYAFNVSEESLVDSDIGIVQATDADIGDNGCVRYYVQNSWGSDLFNINETTGILSVTDWKSMTRDVYNLLIVAKDEGTPKMDAVVSVYIYKGLKDTLPVSTPWPLKQMKVAKEKIEQNLIRILNLTVVIQNIVPITGEESSKSRMYITGNYSAAKLLSAGLDHWEEIQALFYTASCPGCTTHNVPEDHNDFGASEIALVVLACLIIAGAIAAILLIRKQFNSHNRYKRLYENLTKNSGSLYESQELKINLEDETSDYTGSVNTQEIELEDKESDQVQASVNPVFEDRTTELTQVDGSLQDTSTEMEQAMDSLKDLSDRLNKEENPTADYENSSFVRTESGETGLNLENGLSNALYDHTTGDVTEVPEDTPTSNNDVTGTGNIDGTVTVYENLRLDNVPVKNADELTGPTTLENGVPLGQTEAPEISGETGEEIDEPKPDYDIKQVRFSTEVLNTDCNILEPLKTGDVPSEETKLDEKVENGESDDSGRPVEEVVPTFLTEGSDEKDREREEEMDEQGWVEEEINSPTAFATYEQPDPTSTFSFGKDQMTAF